MTRAALCLAIAAALFACKRQKGPDANYDKASRQYQELYATELDDAYGDRKMDQVVALLKLVDPASLDKPDADRLLGTIARGKEEWAKSEAARNAMAAAASRSAATASAPSIDMARILATHAEDAGTLDPYGEGASIAQINSANGGCLVAEEPFTETGTGKTGRVYRLSSVVCNAKLPGFVGQAILEVDGKIYRRVSAALAPRQEPRPPLPQDAGTPPRRTAPAPPASTEDAGYGLYVPGQPFPPGMQEAAPTPDAGY